MIRNLPAYRPLAAFVAPALPRAQLWRTVLGMMLVLAIYALSFLGLFALLYLRYGPMISQGIFFAMASGRTPGAMLLLLVSFAGLGLAPMAVVRLLHRRRAGTLFGPAEVAIHDFGRVALAVLALNLSLLVLSLFGDRLEPDVGFGAFLAWLPAALVAILIQTGAEELVFRGYLLQQLRARFASPLIWGLVPACLFGFGHYAPSIYGPNAIAVALWAVIFGLFAADLTARTGSIGAALGLHFANNVAAFLLVGLKGNMDGLALWTQSVDLASPSALLPLVLVDLLTMVVAWLLARLVLRV